MEGVRCHPTDQASGISPVSDWLAGRGRRGALCPPTSQVNFGATIAVPECGCNCKLQLAVVTLVGLGGRPEGGGGASARARACGGAHPFRRRPHSGRALHFLTLTQRLYLRKGPTCAFRAFPGARGRATRPGCAAAACRRAAVCGREPSEQGEKGAAREPLSGGGAARARGGLGTETGGVGRCRGRRPQSARAGRCTAAPGMPSTADPPALVKAAGFEWCVRAGRRRRRRPRGAVIAAPPPRPWGRTRARPCACGWDGSCAPIAALSGRGVGAGASAGGAARSNALICSRVLAH